HSHPKRSGHPNPEQVPGGTRRGQVRPFRERVPARPLGGLRGEAHHAGDGRVGAGAAHVQARAAAAPGRLMAFAGRHVVLGVSGGIACYKSCTLARQLSQDRAHAGGGAPPHPATRANVKTLAERGWHFVGPDIGPLAEGPSERPGRMSEPAVIFAAAARLLLARAPWRGKTVVVTAGPTREHLDPVRVVTNPSSGRMGYALAEAAYERGADA